MTPAGSRPAKPAPASGGAASTTEWRYRDGRFAAARAPLAIEVPVALQFNGISHAVMLATPCDLEDFALGFALSEGILADAPQLYQVEVEEGPRGVTLEVEIAAAAFAGLKERRRTLAGRTGCGICGTESLDQVLRPLPRITAVGPALAPAALAAAAGALADAQPLGRLTGATHAAAWCGEDGSIRLVREDVGRHNALDKLIGAIVRARIPVDRGFALITSRASVEMVQKAATAGIGILAAVSAPTTLARDVADRCGLTLVGFARGDHFTAYTHPHRVGAPASLEPKAED
jgi:FdhD protein